MSYIWTDTHIVFLRCLRTNRVFQEIDYILVNDDIDNNNKERPLLNWRNKNRSLLSCFDIVQKRLQYHSHRQIAAPDALLYLYFHEKFSDEFHFLVPPDPPCC